MPYAIDFTPFRGCATGTINEGEQSFKDATKGTDDEIENIKK